MKRKTYAKRVISAFLAMLMVFSIWVPVAFAADSEEPTIPPTENVVESNEEQDYKTSKLEVGESTKLWIPFWNVKTTWTSSAPETVAVSECGVLTGVAIGEATVKATSYTLWGELTKKPKQVEKEFNVVITERTTNETVATEVEVGKTASLSGELQGVTTWKSSDKNIVTVAPNGVIEGVAEGTATVTATTYRYMRKFYFIQWGLKWFETQFNVTVRTSEAIPETYTVFFESNGGTAVEKQTVKAGEKATEPNAPQKEGYVFDGWYADDALTNKYDFTAAVTSNITLYAKWKDSNGWDLGEDVIPDLDFEEKEANPTFEDKEHEVANIVEINNGEMPYSDSDENGVPNFIDGEFSDKKVKSADDAIKALNDIHHTMGFVNAEQEFIEVYSKTNGNTSFYRLQQVYHNIPVYGYQLIVTADSEGNIKTLSGHYYPNIDLEIDPKLSVTDAKNVVRGIEGNDIALVSNGLFVFVSEGMPTLTWNIETFSASYFVDASTGVIVSAETKLRTEKVMGTGRDYDGNEISFPVNRNESTNQYLLEDLDRNIHIDDSSHRQYNWRLRTISENNNDNWSNHSDATTAYKNLIAVFDYYSNILGRNGSDDTNIETWLIVNYRDSDNQECDNAYYFQDDDQTLIAIGDSNENSRVRSLDTIGHEYTHSVTHHVWNATYSNESGALDEAYADIIGNLIEDKHLSEHGEHQVSGPIRDFSNPGKFDQPSNYKNHKPFCNLPGDHRTHKRCDNGSVHYNSGIVNHAAYLMDQNWPAENHADELATLFYRSMSYLSSNSTFMDCRHAVLATAKSMNMSNEKREVIANAFKDVGIYHKDEEAWASLHHIKGVVKDAATGNNIIDAQVVAVATKGLGGGVGYTNGTGNFDVRVNRAIYTVSVFAEGYKSFKMENLNLNDWFNMDLYLEDIYLTPNSWGDNTQNVFASGKVTNALTGEPLAGATVKFRSGAGNESGDYMQTVSGIDIELTTDSTGKYYTAALPAGNYTLEASKDGFITGYKNIVSGNSDICHNQNVVLTPELAEGSLRIVLTWGSNPRDLDSHVYGTLTSGGNFHTYFGNKSDFDGSTEVCNLDVDDTQGNGHETITLNPTTKEPYYYYVYQYAGSGSIATSNAKIQVYQGDHLLGTFNAPTDQGTARYWNVFAVVDGKLIVNNTITSSPNTTYASLPNSSAMTLNANDDYVVDQDMPKYNGAAEKSKKAA